MAERAVRRAYFVVGQTNRPPSPPACLAVGSHTSWAIRRQGGRSEPLPPVDPKPLKTTSQTQKHSHPCTFSKTVWHDDAQTLHRHIPIMTLNERATHHATKATLNLEAAKQPNSMMDSCPICHPERTSTPSLEEVCKSK